MTCGNTSITTGYSDGVDFDNNGSVDELGICADDPTAAVISGADSSQTTRDLGVVAGSATSVHAGATATAPFTLKYAGTATGAATFALTATTDIPGATATPAQANFTHNQNAAMNVSVPVPANTTPGTYHANLVATITANGQSRTVPLQGATITVGQNFIFDPAPALPNPLFSTPLTLNGQAQTKAAQMNNFAVNDTTASPSGWNVTVAGDGSGANKAVFTQYCPAASAPCGSDPAGYVSGGRNLAANSLNLNSTGASWTGGTGSAPTFQCGGGSCPIDSATPTKIASAANGSAGTGLWSTSGFSSSSLSLATPSTLRVLPTNEQYRLNVVWTLISGP